jgi:hypothetical protein
MATEPSESIDGFGEPCATTSRLAERPASWECPLSIFACLITFVARHFPVVTTVVLFMLIDDGPSWSSLPLSI